MGHTVTACSEMSEKSVESCLNALSMSLEEALEMMNHFEEGVVLFTTDAAPILFNDSLGKRFPNLDIDSAFFDQLTLLTQKRNGIHFDLKSWLQQLPLDALPEQQVWLKSPEQQIATPTRLQAHQIEFNDTPHLLLILTDESLRIQVEAQKKLMDANYAGQFITNAHGYITQPNYSFCAYTGLSPEELEQLTYIDWLKKQVSFNMPFDSVISALLKERFWTGEVQIFASEDAVFYAVLSISMMLDEANNIEHFIGVMQDITDIREAQSEIAHLSYFDKLTGLANRTLLHDRIEQTLNRADYQDTSNALFFIDLDGFKIINDTFGHNIGDQLLIQVSKKLQKTLPEEATLARIGGAGFAILYRSSFEDTQQAQEDFLQFASQLLDTVDDRYNLEQNSIHSAASIGICTFPMRDVADYRTDQLTSYADMAMYEAKKAGGNQSYLFESTLIEKAKQRLELIEALNHSELDEEFQIYFQGQVDQNGRIMSAETLIRWFHPQLGFVSPSKFIPVAEEGRQIIKIGLWVLHKSFLQAKAWNSKYRPIRIAINISPIQFHEQSFIEIIIGLVKFTRVDPSTITLELTEGVLIKNSKLALQKIQHLVSLGFEVSIDDFGTGYSSLSYLQKLPIHELKIDQSFIQHVPGNADDKAIVDSIIQLATSKNLKIVAEGVETQEQADYLFEQNSDMVQQGYFYSKPMPADEFEQHFILNQEKDSA